MEAEQKQAISLRIKQAQEALVEARLLWEHDLWRGAINRSYYAMFYSVLALAIFKGEILSKHTHAISFFDKEFVKRETSPRNFPVLCITGLTSGSPAIMGKLQILNKAKRRHPSMQQADLLRLFLPTCLSKRKC